MGLIDTTLDVLKALEAQEPKMAVVASAVRHLRQADDEIDGQRYRPDRAAELKAERRAGTVAAIVSELQRLESEADCEAERARAEHAAAQHRRVSGSNGHAVDVARITAATSAAEIVVLLKDAEAADDETLKKTWAHAEPTLKALAAADMREHRLPHPASAFSAWSIWQMRMRNLNARQPDAAAIRERAARSKSELRQKVLAVARVVGLDIAVEQAARRAAVGAVPKGNMTIGKYWDK